MLFSGNAMSFLCFELMTTVMKFLKLGGNLSDYEKQNYVRKILSQVNPVSILLENWICQVLKEMSM